MPDSNPLSHPRLELQLDWDASLLRETWPTTPDNVFIISRQSTLASDVTAVGASGRVLEVAAAEAAHACRLNLRGLETFVVEPSPVMLARARSRMAEHGAHLTFVRGVAETLPFPDHTFDRVLIDAAIDHLGQPELSLREMTRVLKPDGRLVVSFVNYQSLSVRVSRFLYRIARRLHFVPTEQHFFWDTPVPHEHTFECTYDVIQRVCRPFLELDHVVGASLGWQVPGWGPFLKRISRPRALALLQRLDRFAYRRPRLADFVVTRWRPRPSAAVSDGSAARPVSDWLVQPNDLVYAGKVRWEAEHWARVDFDSGFSALIRGGDQMINAAYTGDPTRTWIDDLVARGPFVDAAVLGCDEDSYERYWLQCGASRRLDVYDVSPGVIRKKRKGLGLGWLSGLRRHVRFICTDLNFAALPADAYDVIWSSGSLHHIVNLEHLLGQVERALRPRGLFAIRDYVGERRMQFDLQRLERINAVLQRVPARFRRLERVEPPPLQIGGENVLGLTPFCGVRSDEILPLAERRFEVVHKGTTGALFPLNFALDLQAIEREAPETLRWLQAEEEAAQRDGLQPAAAYVVLRKRS